MYVMVRFAEAFRLKPTTVGKVPLAVIATSASYVVVSANAIDYENAVLKHISSFYFTIFIDI